MNLNDLTKEQLGMIYSSLADKAEELIRYSRRRMWYGPSFKTYRAQLREQAGDYYALALTIQDEYQRRLGEEYQHRLGWGNDPY